MSVVSRTESITLSQISLTPYIPFLEPLSKQVFATYRLHWIMYVAYLNTCRAQKVVVVVMVSHERVSFEMTCINAHVLLLLGFMTPQSSFQDRTYFSHFATALAPVAVLGY